MPRAASTRSLPTLPAMLCLWAGFACWCSLPAQIPGLPGVKAGTGKAAETAPAAAAETPEKTKERLGKQLAETRKQLAASDAGAAVPEGVTPAEVAERRTEVARAAFAIERHLKSLDNAPVSADAAKEAERRAREWEGFEEKAPYSFLFYDELRNQRDAARAKVDAYESTVALIERQVAALQQEFRQAEEANRRATDDFARAKGTPVEAAAAWRLETAGIKLRATGATLALYQAGVQSQQPRIAATKAELALLDRQVNTAARSFVLGDAEIAKAKESVKTKAAAINKEIAALAKRQASLLAERDRLRAEAEVLREKPADDPTQAKNALELLEGRLRGAEAEADTLSFEIDLLGASLRMQSELPAALQHRRNLSAEAASEDRLAARKGLAELAERSRGWAVFVTNERAAVSATVREQESRLTALAENDPRRAAEERVLAAQWRRTEVVDRLDQAISGYLRTLERWLADGDQLLRERSTGARVADIATSLWDGVRKVWSFEVYRYEDKVEVDGETITVKRGLTLGRMLGALVFFLVAYRIGSWVSRKVQRTAVNHGWIGEAQARTLRRWAMVAVGAVLALLTLQMLRIPVTAFAFLGGALAIGIGFGTQTLFKNFISGIIVLAERKVKVGDILDVDGIVGTVTAVDTRSSTIRGFDGVETLVPNSLLLENKVTNWTHTSAKVRRVLRVGVAYGSPVQQVSEILAECAGRHGLVLKEPAPVVVFEDFGADSLVFAVYFWVELNDRTNPNVVGSDLRFMLDKRFNDAGISIAYPQRDVHLNAATPLKIEMVAPPRGENQ